MARASVATRPNLPVPQRCCPGDAGASVLLPGEELEELDSMSVTVEFTRNTMVNHASQPVS